ncbi:PH domain-containing protein [Agaribacter flavus]|uniref:PH domain-containing protein n=1 Tax=Agaribacter flavus TaxID=1902781 RepID=A0ABV7FVI9_9ALTE
MSNNEQGLSNTNKPLDDWSRVAPIGIAYFFFKSLFFFITNIAFYLIPALVLQSDKIKQHLDYVFLAVLCLLAVFMVFALFKYFFYTFKLSNDRIEIKQGVLRKTHLDLPFEKIQNVKIEQAFYYRFNDYATVELETAGSSQQEAKIVALKLHEAEALKARVLHTIKHRTDSNELSSLHAEQATSVDSDASEHILNTRSIGDLVIHGITNNRIWILLGAAAPFYNPIVENIGAIMEAIGFDIAGYLDYNSQSLGLFILHILSIVMVIMLAVVLLSVIGSIFVFYNYQLSKQGARYIKRSGLITKQEVSMKASRIQVAIQQQDWLDRIIGRANVKFAQNSTSQAGHNQGAQLNVASSLVVPSVTPTESDALIHDVFKQASINHRAYQHINPRYILRLLIFPVIPVCVLLFVVAYLASFNLIGWIIVSLVSVLLVGLSVLRWYRWGYDFSEDFVCIRKGLLGVDFSIFPLGKIQQTKVKQTVLMEAHKLASIQMVLASGAHSIPYLPDDVAIALMDRGLLIVEKDKPAWM